MSNKYQTFNHAKTRLRYHLIFSTKYRKKLLLPIKDKILTYCQLAKEKSSGAFNVEFMDIDKDKPDHIHFVVSGRPGYSISEIVHKLKQITTYYIWKENHDYMKQFYWGTEHHLWTRGYFASTIGEVSEKTLKSYIEKQG